MYKQVPALVQNYVALFLFKIEWHCTTIPENLKKGQVWKAKIVINLNSKKFLNTLYFQRVASPEWWDVAPTVGPSLTQCAVVDSVTVDQDICPIQVYYCQ